MTILLSALMLAALSLTTVMFVVVGAAIGFSEHEKGRKVRAWAFFSLWMIALLSLYLAAAGAVIGAAQ